MTLAQDDRRLRSFLDATLPLNSELSLDLPPRTVVETAASVTGARYAALGASDETGAALAIENARLYEAATRWSRRLETLHDVVQALVGETDSRHCSTWSAAGRAS